MQNIYNTRYTLRKKSATNQSVSHSRLRELSVRTIVEYGYEVLMKSKRINDLLRMP